MNRIFAGLSSLCLVALVACGDVTPPGGGGGADAFVPVPDPTVGSLTPERGPLGGGTIVTVTGTGFADNAENTTVIVGAFVGTNVTVNSDTELSFETPAGLEPGPATVTVFNEAGAVMSDITFTYNELPAITGIDIDTGVAAGGLEVTVTGTGFSAYDAGTNAVDIGGTAGTNVTVNSDTELTFETGTHTGASFVFLDVSVTNDNGTAVLGESFRYLRRGLLAAANSRAAFEGVDLYFIDPATGDTISLGKIGGGAMTRGITGMAPVGDGRLYAATTRDWNLCCDRTLITFDPLHLDTVSPIGTLRNTATNSETGVMDLARVGTSLYGATRDNSRLVTIDPTTALYTDVSATALPCCIQPSAFTPDGMGNVFWLRYPNQALRRVNVSTAASSDVSMLQGMGSRIGGAVLFNGVLYAVTFDPPSRLMSINPTTGVVQDIGAVPRYFDSLTTTPW